MGQGGSLVAGGRSGERVILVWIVKYGVAQEIEEVGELHTAKNDTTRQKIAEMEVEAREET